MHRSGYAIPGAGLWLGKPTLCVLRRWCGHCWLAVRVATGCEIAACVWSGGGGHRLCTKRRGICCGARLFSGPSRRRRSWVRYFLSRDLLLSHIQRRNLHRTLTVSPGASPTRTSDGCGRLRRRRANVSPLRSGIWSDVFHLHRPSLCVSLSTSSILGIRCRGLLDRAGGW